MVYCLPPTACCPLPTAHQGVAMNLKRPADRGFVIGTMLLATSVLLVTAAILLGIASGSTQSLQQFGLGFIVNRTWDPVQEVFGALPFIYGTLVTSLSALPLPGL